MSYYTMITADEVPRITRDQEIAINDLMNVLRRAGQSGIEINSACNMISTQGRALKEILDRDFRLFLHSMNAGEQPIDSVVKHVEDSAERLFREMQVLEDNLKIALSLLDDIKG